MRKHLAVLGIVFLAAACVPGCGDDETQISITTPVVTSTVPANGATGVNLNATISVTFSEEMQASSLDSIYVNGRAVSRVVYDNSQKTATAYLDSLLEPETVCQVKVSSYCMDRRGNNLNGDHTFSFTTGVMDCENVEDYFEPDNSIAAATPADFDTDYLLLSSCGGSARFDFFEFTLSQAAQVKATVEILYQDTTRVNWLWAYLRADGEDYTSAGTNASGENPISWSHSFKPGTYYLQIGRYYDDPYINVYNLTLQALAACIDDTYEDNDFFDEAVPLEEGTYNLKACMHDKDFFYIDVHSGHTLSVTLTGAAGQTRRLYVHNPDRTLFAGVQNTVDPAIVSGIATQTGTHYIEIMYWVDDIDYELEIDVTGP
jgi:hypothetical protein